MDKIPYVVLELGTGLDDMIPRLIESGLDSFMKSIPVLDQVDQDAPEAEPETAAPLWLDLL